MRFKLFLLLFFIWIPSLIFSQSNQSNTNSRTAPKIEYTGFGIDYDPPYFVNMGYRKRHNDIEFMAPYIGIGIGKTKYSLSWLAHVGGMISYRNIKWKLEFYHTFIPDMTLFDFNNLEYYVQSIFQLYFDRVSLLLITRYGNLIFTKNTYSSDLNSIATTCFALDQIMRLSFTVFDNSLIIMSGLWDLDLEYIPHLGQVSWSTRVSLPLTFNFIHSKLGIKSTLFFTQFLGSVRKMHIGEQYLGYENAIPIGKNSSPLYYQHYNLIGSIDMVYRIYLQFLQGAWNRIYVAGTANIGFGSRVFMNNTAFYYMWGAAIGYEYKDVSPIEFRIGLDQDRKFYILMNIISPISHQL